MMELFMGVVVLGVIVFFSYEAYLSTIDTQQTT
jgi:hypothetical protein